MTRPLVTVVGHCTSTSARIFCCAPPPNGAPSMARVAWRVEHGNPRTGVMEMILRGAEPYSVGVFDLGGLPPGGRVEYAIAVGKYASDLPDKAELLAGPLASFRLLPAGRPPRIALVSCNGVWNVSDEKRKYALWKSLKAEIDAGRVDLVVHAGDQIYADPIWMAHDADARKMGLRPTNKGRMADLTREYRKWYEKTWSAEPVAAVLASVPNVMTWDDHDIYDGYGSHDDDDEAPQQAFFLAAKQAFEEFQTMHGPGPLHPESSLAGFTHEGVGVVLLDTRTNRMWNARRVLGDAQLAAFDAWCAANVAGLKRLYVVASIPLVHANVAGALAALWLKPGREDIEDDLRDAWTASNNRDECQRLTKRLFALQAKHPELQVTVLSGDVHVGAIAELRSRLPAHRAPGGDYSRMFQITSSGIGHPPPEGFGMFLITQATRSAVTLGTEDIQGRLVELNGADGLLLKRRNFAILHLTDAGGEAWEPHGNLTVEFHGEVPGGTEPLVQVCNGPGR